MRITATVERAGDGSWTAAVIGEHSVLGTGATKDAALENLRVGVADLLEELKTKGEPWPQSNIEVVSIEVAA